MQSWERGSWKASRSRWLLTGLEEWLDSGYMGRMVFQDGDRNF